MKDEIKNSQASHNNSARFSSIIIGLRHKKRCKGILHLNHQNLTLECDEELNVRRWSWKDIKVFQSGTGNNLLFFRPSSQFSEFDSTYITLTPKIMRQLTSLNIDPINEVLRSHKRKKVRTTSLVVGLIVGFILLGYGLWMAKGPLIDSVVSKIPYSVEQTLGRKILGLTMSPSQLISSGPVHMSLMEQLDPLLSVLPEEMRDVDMYISLDSQINAFALPGGVIVFNEGLLRRATRIEQVLGVGAHELAHVKERHVMRGMVQALGTFTLLNVFLGDITGVIGVLSDNGQYLMQMGFSRSQENDADRVGFDLLVDAHIDPSGIVEFFEILKAESKKRLEDQPELDTLDKAMNSLSFLSSHPATEDRISTTLQRVSTLNETIKPKAFDYDSFKSMLSTLSDSE